jgi:aspartate kinase
MALIVQKYGGTSVADLGRIRNVAKRVLECKKRGNEMVVVVSAMAGETDRLIRMADEISPAHDEREHDTLVSTGEQVTTALLAMTIIAMGEKARSLQGHQVKIITDSAFTRARVERIDVKNIHNVLKAGNIVVVAGFQGIDSNENITTLGRGGSDTTAVALAAALKADVCEIYTDVEGVYTADPRICTASQKIPRICFEEMIELASLGSKVLHIRSVEFAMKYNVPIHVRSSLSNAEGTLVTVEDSKMEQMIVRGVAHDFNQAKITLVGVQDRPGVAYRIFEPISKAGIPVDMIIQNASEHGMTDLTFTVQKTDYRKALDLVKSVSHELKAKEVRGDLGIAKVSVIGVGMRTHAGAATTMFEALSKAGINILMISTSEIKISCVIDEKYTELAVRVLHEAFKLAGRPEAVRKQSRKGGKKA